MTVIEASSVAIKTMADGTLRVTFDVEPRHAQDAFALFGSPGTPSALAALKAGAQAGAKPDTGGTGAASAPAKADKPIARWLALRCKEPDFQRWIRAPYDRLMGGDGTRWGDIKPEDVGGLEQYARHAVLVFCEVRSRGDIDGDLVAEERFQRLIRGPWAKHCIASGVTA